MMEGCWKEGNFRIVFRQKEKLVSDIIEEIYGEDETQSSSKQNNI